MTAMFALSSVATAASVLDGLKLSGEMTVNKVQVKNENTATTDNDDYRSESRSRIMLNMAMPLNDDVDARVVLSKNNRKYGQAEENLTNVQTQLDVVNAYVKVQGLFDLIDLKAGRMFYGKQGDLAMYYGPGYDYGLGVSALDGYLASAEIAGINVKYLDAKVAEMAPTADSDSDVDLQGLVLSPVDKIADMVSGEFYAYKNVDNLAGDATHNTDTTLLYGIKAAAEVGGVDVNAEYAMNGGEDETTKVKYKGSAMIVGASMKVSDVNVRAEMASGSGNETASADNEDFTADGSDIGYGEVWGNTPATGTVTGGAGIQNLNVVNIGADYDVNDKVKASADYLMLKRNEVAAGAEDKIGSELDLKVRYAHSENVSLDLVLARLMSDKALADPASDIDKVNLQMNIKF